MKEGRLDPEAPLHIKTKCLAEKVSLEVSGMKWYLGVRRARKVIYARSACDKSVKQPHVHFERKNMYMFEKGPLLLNSCPGHL